MTTETPRCPECTGEWLNSFRFRHRGGCSIGTAQDQTQANDALYGWRTRAATDAEVRLADEAFDHPVIEAAKYRRQRDPVPKAIPIMTEVRDADLGIPHLIVGGFDPDAITDEGNHNE